jgi:hypothetical protein
MIVTRGRVGLAALAALVGCSAAEVAPTGTRAELSTPPPRATAPASAATADRPAAASQAARESAAAPAGVILHLQPTPEGARVLLWVDEAAYPTAPGAEVVEVPRGAVVEALFAAPGYEPEQLVLLADRSRDIEIALRERGAAERPAASRGPRPGEGRRKPAIKGGFAPGR